MTSQNIWLDNAAIWLAGALSICSQTKASNEVNGSAATRAANPVDLLAISEMATISSAEMITLSA